MPPSRYSSRRGMEALCSGIKLATLVPVLGEGDPILDRRECLNLLSRMVFSDSKGALQRVPGGLFNAHLK
jgi:hypothetical protein